MTVDAEADQGLRAARARGYETPRPDVLAHVPYGARNVLELGCSTGALGDAVKRRQPARVVGVEFDAGYAAEAAGRLDRVIVGDAQAVLTAGPLAEAPFDCLIAADVLEHLVDPWTTLRLAVAGLSPGATVVVSLPNILWYRGLLRVVLTQRWPRDVEGVFDGTHLRWFTLRDAHDLLLQAGVEPGVVDPRYWEEGWRLRVRRLLARTPLMPFLAPQYVMTGRKPAG